MKRIGLLLWLGVAAVALGWGGHAAAQAPAWVQVEARPTLAQAEERARDYAGRIENVQGFRLGSGWYAIALGPYDPVLAEGELFRLRSARQIPGDSFVSDGGNFSEQFWPVGARGAVGSGLATPPDTAVPVVAPPPEPADETPAEARAAERLMTREEREELQRALQAAGFYDARIDGSFGAGTRRSMAAWQASQGYETTGVMTTMQRRELVESYRGAISTLGLAPVFDTAAGIEITLPLGEVSFADYEAPFARYDGDEAQVLLISQSGDIDTLRGLYDILQTLEIVPLQGPRDFFRDGFRIEGANDRIVTRVEARLTRDGVKGFALVWPAEDRLRRGLALAAMQESFASVDGVVLPDTAGSGAIQRPDLLAGLQIRQPDVSASGFFVDADGTVLTASGAVGRCSRITLDGETEADRTAADEALGLALLTPRARLAPIGIGRLRTDAPRLQSEIAVAGYSYGGVLGAPTISFGTLEDVRGLDGEDPLTRLALSARPGDSGGPVLDFSGRVVGMLLPEPGDDSQTLPEEVRFAADAAAIAAFLAANGVASAEPPAPEPVPETPLVAQDIALIGADMTVLVECWN